MTKEEKLREYMSEFVTAVTDCDLDEAVEVGMTPGYEAGVIAYRVAERVERERLNEDTACVDERH